MSEEVKISSWESSLKNYEEAAEDQKKEDDKNG